MEITDVPQEEKKSLTEMLKVCQKGYPAFKQLPPEEQEPILQLVREKREAELKGARKLMKSVGQDVKHVSDKVEKLVRTSFKIGRAHV